MIRIGPSPGLVSKSRLDLMRLPGMTVEAAYRAENYTAGDWPDRSPNARDLTQGTGSLQPALVSSDADYGGRPVIEFTSDRMQTASFSFSQPLTVILIGENNLANASNKQFFDGRTSGSSGRALARWSTAELVAMFAGGSTLTGTTGNDVPAVYVFEFNGASSEIKVDGSSEATGNAGTDSIVNGFTLGDSEPTGSFFGGRIAELVILSTAMTTASEEYLASYASEYYGL